MTGNIDDIVIPILRTLQSNIATIQSDIAAVKGDISALKENTGKLAQRMTAVEAHMSGFLSTARYHEHEINELRGRLEALEQARHPDNPL
jgi:septal ring factor EnvC (AmiA/AmiB activator)